MIIFPGERSSQECRLRDLDGSVESIQKIRMERDRIIRCPLYFNTAQIPGARDLAYIPLLYG
jgi:hypothetical protein